MEVSCCMQLSQIQTGGTTLSRCEQLRGLCNHTWMFAPTLGIGKFVSSKRLLCKLGCSIISNHPSISGSSFEPFAFDLQKPCTKLLNTMSIPIQMHPAWSYTIIARTSIKVDLICLTNSLWLWWRQPLPACSLLEADFPSWQTICQGHYPFANTTGRNGGLRNKCDTKNRVPLLLLLQQRSPERHHNLHSAAHPGTKF